MHLIKKKKGILYNTYRIHKTTISTRCWMLFLVSSEHFTKIFLLVKIWKRVLFIYVLKENDQVTRAKPGADRLVLYTNSRTIVFLAQNVRLLKPESLLKIKSKCSELLKFYGLFYFSPRHSVSPILVFLSNHPPTHSHLGRASNPRHRRNPVGFFSTSPCLLPGEYCSIKSTAFSRRDRRRRI